MVDKSIPIPRLPFNFNYEFKTLKKRIELDNKTFPHCHTKETKVWSWRKMRNVVHMIHHRDGGYDIVKLE